MKPINQPYMNQSIDLDEWTREILAWHFNPETGSPFWLNKMKQLDFDPIEDVKSYGDLIKFGIFDDHVLTEIPMVDFIPKGMLASRSHIRIFETGGTLGNAKRIIDISYRQSLSKWLSYNLDMHGFPNTGNWLHFGPAGPHVVGYSSGSLSHLRNGLCYFLDIDTRWIKRCVRKHNDEQLDDYLEHVTEQAIAIIKTQDISILFTTPKLLLRLTEKLPLNHLSGVILGGTHITPGFHKLIREEIIPGIPLCIFYGNTLMGVAPQARFSGNNDYNVKHYGFAPYFITHVVDKSDPFKEVGYGDVGRIRFSTLTKDYFLPHVLERDEAIRICGNDLYNWDGVANVRPLKEMEEAIIEGVY